MRRVLIASVAAVLAASILCGCGGKGTSDNTGTGDPGSASGTVENVPVSTVPAETEAPQPYADLKLDGYDFLVFEAAFNWSTVSYNEFAFVEDGGTILDSAIFNRNSAVEDALDILIDYKQVICVSTSGSNEGFGAMLKMKTSGDADYDIAILPGYDQSQCTLQQCNYDLNSISSLDLHNAWWDSNAVDSLEIKGMNFFTTGDYSVDIFNSTICVMFNKELARTYLKDNLYDIVGEGKWTMPVWMEYTKMVSNDLNGDNMFTDADLYGSAVWDDAVYGVVNGCGGLCCEINDDGDMLLTLGTERVINAYSEYCEFVLTNDSAMRYQFTYDVNGKATFSAGSQLETTMFTEDKALFLVSFLGLTSKFRDMDTDYGILPMFKYDETQEKYYNTVAPYNSRFLSVPVNVEDPDTIGKVLEIIGYYSSKFILPAYYNKMLYGTLIRDEESRPMLELIHENRIYDVGYYYQPAEINKHLLYLFRDSKWDWATRYASLEKAANKKLERINSQTTKLAEEWDKS